MPSVEDNLTRDFPLEEDTLGFHLKRLLNNLGIDTPDEENLTVEDGLPFFRWPSWFISYIDLLKILNIAIETDQLFRYKLKELLSTKETDSV
jgi:hypothetical protein